MRTKGYVSSSMVAVVIGWSCVTTERFVRECGRVQSYYLMEAADFCLRFFAPNSFSCTTTYHCSYSNREIYALHTYVPFRPPGTLRAYAWNEKCLPYTTLFIQGVAPYLWIRYGIVSTAGWTLSAIITGETVGWTLSVAPVKNSSWSLICYISFYLSCSFPDLHTIEWYVEVEV
jgi:hypothetical protein